MIESIDLRNKTNEEIGQLVKEMSAEQIKNQVDGLNPDQIPIIFISVNESHDSDWRKKTIAALNGLTHRPLLEAAGRTLTVSQVLEIIDQFPAIEALNRKRFLSIFIHMPPRLFSEIMTSASEQQLSILKQESTSEPLHHQLTVFCHETTSKLANDAKRVERLEKEIEALDIEGLGRQDLKAMWTQIEEIKNDYMGILKETNKALALAWNTNREDIIDKLNYIKDNCQKVMMFSIGHLPTQDYASSGLFLKLEERLSSVYGNPKNIHDSEALEDDEAAIDALLKFSIWQLQDYWEIGLLPEIESIKALDLDSSKYSERERANYREKLFNLAQANLAKIGIATVKDLKNAQIFSKKTLYEYIQNRP